MPRLLHLLLVAGLSLSLSGVAGVFSDDDCASDCASESEDDPCKSGEAPCATCFACPCAHRLPAVASGELPVPALQVLSPAEERAIAAPTAPPPGRPFQPPRG